MTTTSDQKLAKRRHSDIKKRNYIYLMELFILDQYEKQSGEIKLESFPAFTEEFNQEVSIEKLELIEKYRKCFKRNFSKVSEQNRLKRSYRNFG
jgi:geranylgeranyl pyrophosphate synthase